MQVELGEYPSYEHVYLYNAIMIATGVLMEIGGDKEGQKAAIPVDCQPLLWSDGVQGPRLERRSDG